MIGYRAYFDEKANLFVAEEQPREFKDDESIPNNDFEAYYTDYESAVKAAGHQNQHLNCIKYCKDCGKKFWLSEDEELWFNQRGLKVPVRCPSCREAKRRKNGNGFQVPDIINLQYE